MSKSKKARYSTKGKFWKDTVLKSANQVRSRAKWRKVTKNSPKKTRNSRKPQRDLSFMMITGAGLYDPKTKSIEPFDDD